MKRSEELVKGRVEEGEVKRSKTEDAEESAPEINPFLVEPVLVKLLKHVGRVSQLKELRLMCQTWDEFNLKELEDRAFNGKVKAIDFCWTSISSAKVNLVQFMEDTQSIPRLFSRFKFNFPESWTILSKHMEFFSLYPVTFVNLGIREYFDEPQAFLKLVAKFMETELWGNLKEITVSSIVRDDEEFGLPSSFLFVPASGNMERKLQKLDMKILIMQSSPILRIFESAFASRKYTDLTSIKLAQLRDGKLNFPGLDPSKLTQLEIGLVDRGSAPALEFTSGLVKLARGGMALKNFSMGVDLTPNRIEQLSDETLFEHLRFICSNLTHFLTSQSSTLENLNFHFVCSFKNPMNVPEGAEIWCKIHLPIFEALHTLKLWADFQFIEANPRIIHTKLFGMTHNPAAHFPKLVNLTLDGESSLVALNLNPATDEADQLQLKRLVIPHTGLHDSSIWSTSFLGVIGSVEELTCPAKLLYGERHPWGESLRQLQIRNIGVEQMAFFKLNHFKNLERLLVRYHFKDGQISTEYGGDPNLSMKVEDYLATFKEATELPLTSIFFMGPNMEEEVKEQFIQYFPFRVRFHIPI